MEHFQATDAKNKFGVLLETALQNKVSIDKNGRPVAVLMSRKEYDRLSEIEDTLLAIQAKMAKEDLLTHEESEKLLRDILDA